MATRRDSRQLILSAAATEFGLQGFAGARVERIAAAAGVNKQLIFYYFGSKAGLFQAILAAVADRVVRSADTVQDGESPLEQLRSTITRVWGVIAAHAELVRAALLESSRAPAAASAVSGALRPVLEQIRGLVSRGQGLGYVRDDVDPDAVAVQVLATAVGYASLRSVMDQQRPRSEDGTPLELLMRTLAW